MGYNARISCSPTAGTLVDTTESFPPNECAGFVSGTAYDVWYWFVATGTTSTVQADGDGDLDVVLELFIDSCSTAAPIECSDNTFDGGLEEFTFATTAGQFYFYRIYDFTPGTPATTFTFTTCVIGDNSVFDCEGVPGGTALPGTPCDDGNPSTVNDTWNANCACTGAFIPPCNACFTAVSNQPWVIEFSNCTNGRTAPYTYVWTFSDGSANSIANPTWTLVAEGEYIACLTISDANGCASTMCDTLYVDANGGVSTGFVPCTACIDVVPATDGPTGPLLPWTVFANNCSTGGPSQYTYNITWGDVVEDPRKYPSQAVLKLASPFSLTLLRVSEEAAKQYVQRVANKTDRYGREMRQAYARFRVRVDVISGIKPIGQDTMYMFQGKLIQLDIFEDRNMTSLLYSQGS